MGTALIDADSAVDTTDLIANLNDFNDHAYNRFVEKIKVR